MTLCCAQRRDSRIVAAEQILSLPEGQSMRMGSRSRAPPEPWPLPPVRTGLETEARLLNSEVQDIFGAEEVMGDELASGLQLQWAAQAEFPNVVRLFELYYCAIPLTSAGDGGMLAVLAVAGLHSGT